MSRSLTRRHALAGLFALAYPAQSQSTCTVWVFGLLRPSELNVYSYPGSRLHCASPAGAMVLEGQRRFPVNASLTPLRISGPNESAVPFILEVPGVIQRPFLGTLKIESKGALLDCVIAMSREVAVSCIVGAELPPARAPLHALAAQAVVARSFLAATRAPRHAQAQFCDTTHCQFLRSPAPEESSCGAAVRLTQGLILTSNSQMFPARYSAACGGQTGSRLEDGYLYQSVACEICRQRGLARRGHGLGLCQEGAMGLAHAGWHWRAILQKYYPDAFVQAAL